MMAREERTKDEVLEQIETAHRQLERTIFYFEKGEAVFSASNRPKFNRVEMLQSGVWGEWSLKDLLVFIIKSEERLTALLDDPLDATVASPLLSSVNWEERLDPEQVPAGIEAAGLDEALANFPLSYQAMAEKLKEKADESLFRHGAFAWAGEHTVAEYICLLTVDLYDWVKGLVRRWKKRHSGEQLNKEIILERICTERQRLEKSLKGVPPEEMEMRGVVGEWSLKDLLAHLVEWERMFMGWYQAGLRGEFPQVPAQGYGWSEMDALNEHIYQKHRERALDEILGEFGSSYRQIYALVESIPEEEMFASGSYTWVGKGSLVSYILANTAHHYRWAKDKVRAWMEGRGNF